MIKVCHIVNLITGKADGVYAHLKMIFENSDKNQFEHILIFQGGEKVEREVKDVGVKVFVSESLKKKISVKAFSDIFRIIKKNKIDIIHTHLIKPYAIAGLVNIILRKKFIFNYHGLFIFRNVYYGFIEKLIYQIIHFILYIFRVVDAVLVPSKRSKELLQRETKLFPEPIVYYNGYSFNQPKSEPDFQLVKLIEHLKQNKIIIAVIGRLEVDKRIDRAIEIVKRLTYRGTNVHLLVFGDGRLKDELKNLIDREGLNENAELLGFVEGIQNYYHLFDIILFTSDWEGMPLSIWEAMANKVPVVATAVGGIPEVFNKHNCGLLFEKDDIDDAVAKLQLILSDNKLRNIITENGRKAVEELYNSEKFMKWLDQLYTYLAGTVR